MSNNFYMPRVSLMGKGCLNEIIPEINNMNVKKALIVTDKVLMEVGIVAKVTDILKENHIDFVIFDEVKPNPTVHSVNDGLAAIKNSKCDFVISLGGGSAHDCAKGMALLATNGGEIKDYEGVNKSKRAMMPLVAINTTAGTGSEMTLFAIITDEDRHVKMALVDNNLTPNVAVNDPALMTAMPKGLTAATGMDALTHAVEAFVSINATPVTDACAEKAIRLIVGNLEHAVEHGDNMEARENMAYAEYLAGMAFNNAGLGYVHAIAHQLGGFYNLPHGVCNAILLPHVQVFNSSKVADRLRLVAGLMGQDIDGVSDEDGAKLCIEAIQSLADRVRIPAGLEEVGVKTEDFEILATNALKDACGATNPVRASLDDIIGILKSAF
ncbi:MAG: iron-containing alcohol dehydrogenase [Sarcina sp.]